MFGTKKSGDEPKIELVVLKSVDNIYEESMIQSLLEEEQIPYIIKDQGAGAYMKVYAGGSFYATDILVDKSVYQKAMEVISAIGQQEEV